MSDGFNPSVGAIEKFGESIQRLIGAFGAAEANTEYKSAYEVLRKSTIDFNNSLATDPEPEKYVDKWNKAKDDIWKNSTRMVKNPQAMRALQDAWQEIDVKQYDSISGIQTNARVERTVDTAINASQAIVQDNSISNEDRKKKLRDLWTPIKASGMRKPETVDTYLRNIDKAVDQSAMEEGLRQLGKAQGYDYAIDQIDNPDFANFFPSLTPEDRDTVRGKMTTEFRWGEQQIKLKIHDNNSKIEDQFSHDLLNGKLTPDAIDKANLMNEPGGRNAGDIRKEWRATLLQHPGRGISDPVTLARYNRWYFDPDVSHDPDAVRRQLRALNNDMGKLTEADYNRIGKDFLNLLTNPNKADPSFSHESPEWAKLRTQMPDQSDAIDREFNYYAKWRSMNRDAPDSEVQKMSAYFQKHVKGNVLDQAMDDILTTPVPDTIPSRRGGRTEQSRATPPKQFPNAQQVSIGGKTAWRDGNTIVMTDDNGVQWKSVNGGPWTRL